MPCIVDVGSPWIFGNPVESEPKLYPLSTVSASNGNSSNVWKEIIPANYMSGNSQQIYICNAEAAKEPHESRAIKYHIYIWWQKPTDAC